MESKTAKEILRRSSVPISPDSNLGEDIIGCMVTYAQQQCLNKYSKSEVEALIKKVLDDAAERVVLIVDNGVNKHKSYSPIGIGQTNIGIDKESITNINLNDYLTK